MRPVLFRIGNFPIYAYGASLTVAFIVGAWFGARRAARRGLDPQHVWNIATWAFVAALLGARLLHVVFEKPDLASRPAEWFRFWEGGLVFYGGFIGAVASSIVYCRVRKLDFWAMADVIAPSIALGHAIVRIGCFLNGCCYGHPASWGVVFPVVDDVPRAPTQLYEAVVGVLLVLALLVYERRLQRVAGELVLLYGAAYGLARFLIEIARADDRGGTWLGLTVSQWIGLAAFVASLALLLGRRRRGTGPQAPNQAPAAP